MINNSRNKGIINMNEGDAQSEISNSTSPVVTTFVIIAAVLVIALALLFFGRPDLIPKILPWVNS